jgi:hypothetical protein
MSAQAAVFHADGHRDVRGVVASVAGAQPGVEHTDRVTEAVRVADHDERPTAGDGGAVRPLLFLQLSSAAV